MVARNTSIPFIRKCRRRGLLFSEIYDLVGFRIIVNEVRECYEALGIVHSHWRPVPGRFKDYIALQKKTCTNHSIRRSSAPTGSELKCRFVLRTCTCRRARIAAHWTYKEGRRGLEEGQRFTWLRQLVEWQQQLKDPQEFCKQSRGICSPKKCTFSPQR